MANLGKNCSVGSFGALGNAVSYLEEQVDPFVGASGESLVVESTAKKE
jgi:hypothetical protein